MAGQCACYSKTFPASKGGYIMVPPPKDQGLFVPPEKSLNDDDAAHEAVQPVAYADLVPPALQPPVRRGPFATRRQPVAMLEQIRWG